jgi:hypothetical protein
VGWFNPEHIADVAQESADALDALVRAERSRR